MAVLSLTPAFSLLAAFGRVSPTQPLRTFIRTTGYKLRPPKPVAHSPRVRTAQEAVLGAGRAGPHQMATLLCEQRKGPTPTIVLGGFVPDATEQVFLLRGFLLKKGSVYYLNYPRQGFSAELLFAQLDDLVEELARRHGTPPVIFAVSFGGGLLLEWLRRVRHAGRHLELRGVVLVSPISCIEDLLAPGEAKPSTLLGRAVKPYLEGTPPDARQIEKSRTIFARMFEAGAQNKAALATLMSPDELRHLHKSVMETIAGVDARGACERMAALRQFQPPSSYFSQALLPLTSAPALILFAENEGAVLAAHAPTRFAMEAAHRAYFPNSLCKTVFNHRGSPVQHASLIFHCFNFLIPISRFYRELKTGKLLRAA
ncbi:MAG: alpha/beta hydrolase [Verrucomicrobia bacterium]|nr:alpha/beta hydrolase [Verrucomicrobiota bacterium]